MRIFVCFDDTDTIDADRGTGKLVRWFEHELPRGCTLWGVVRQQLLVDPAIPYTSHNSSACAIVEAPDASFVPELIRRGAEHIARNFIEGSDPGLCVVADDNPALAKLVAFGKRAAIEVVTQNLARVAADGAHLSGHGGTNDGIIGAAAGVGLTAWGWSGRFVEFGGLREYPAEVTVGEIEADGMMVLPVDRNVVSPKPSDIIATGSWLRPRLWGGRPCLPVTLEGPGRWLAIGKRPKTAEGEVAKP
ncbi:MAG TPA: hypothetical protein VFG89_05915 [Coriobacteriia bacterium]|nr:hypothetical protein [Coriobacteriia bacterium]